MTHYFLDAGNGFGVISETNVQVALALQYNHPGELRLYSFDALGWKEILRSGKWFTITSSAVPDKVRIEAQRLGLI